MNQTQAKSSISFREYAVFLRRYLSTRMPLVTGLGITLFINIGLQLINPQILRSFIDSARAGAENNILVRMAFIFIGVAVSQQLINILVVYLTENLGWATTNQIRLDLARHALGLDMSFHTSHTPGEMIERIDGDVMALSNFFSQFILQVFGNSLLIIGILIVLLREDWRVTLTLTVFVAITVIILLRLANISTSSWEEERKASADLYGFLEERISGTEDIRSNNARDYVLDRFYRLTRTLMRKTITAGLKVNILLNTTWSLFAVGLAVSFLISGALFFAGSITLGTAFMIVFYTNMLTWPIERITQQMQDLQRAGASLIRIFGIQRIQGKIPGESEFTAPRADWLKPGPLAVEFRDVTFGYSDSAVASSANEEKTSFVHGDLSTGDVANAAFAAALDPRRWQRAEVKKAQKEIVLHDISFNLPPGRVIGLLGRTGSGKTTLTRLLFRLYDPDTGSILLGSNGRMADLRKLPVQELRRGVGMVTQNIQLFHATVRENLTFFDPSIPDERIHEAISDLGLEKWFQSLPNGLDTELESGGGGLSAGEAQLLAFTRIFLRDPGLVILDEATSRLDPATESLIEQAVGKLVHNRTAIIVAHRLGTVQRADDILILEDGQIIEYGERASLAGDPSTHFHRLLETGLEEVLA
ncbi:MAG: ABC transporter ATP-binding protein [Anaerolineaceae bacterium]|nr:ABC transporter ATP-binding protein [Anaerolineaceae bacterium]